MPTGQYVVIAIIAAVCVVAVARFELICFQDLAKHRDDELGLLSRSGWMVVIAVVIPLGGVFYLFYGRAR